MRYLFFFALTLAITSCSSDDDGGNGGTGSGMLEKIVYNFGGGLSETIEYEYDGTKLSKITYSGGNVDVTYNGDVITEMLTYEGEAEPVESETFEYDDMGRIAVYTYKELDFGYGTKEMYVHNDDGTISYTRYEGDQFAQNDLQNTGKIFFEGGEVSKIEEYFPGYTTIREYEYDDMKNPMMMITGMGKISFVDGIANGINHNVISESYQDDFESATETTSYTYTNAQFPATEEVENPDETTSAQYFYN